MMAKKPVLVELDLKASGSGAVRLNGVNVSHSCEAVEVVAGANSPTRVTLVLNNVDVKGLIEAEDPHDGH